MKSDFCPFLFLYSSLYRKKDAETLGGLDFCLYLCGMTDKSRYVRFDWAIKRILRDKANKEVLEGLITVLLGEAVTITEILETENNKNRFEWVT